MTNPIIQIGSFEIPIAAVMTVRKLSGAFGWRKYFSGKKYLSWLAPRYAVALSSGLVIYLSEKDKQQLDYERGLHSAAMQVYGMFHGWQQSHGLR